MGCFSICPGGGAVYWFYRHTMSCSVVSKSLFFIATYKLLFVSFRFTLQQQSDLSNRFKTTLTSLDLFQKQQQQRLTFGKIVLKTKYRKEIQTTSTVLSTTTTTATATAATTKVSKWD